MSTYDNDPRVTFLADGSVRVAVYAEYSVTRHDRGWWGAEHADNLRRGSVRGAWGKATVDEVLHALIGDPR